MWYHTRFANHAGQAGAITLRGAIAEKRTVIQPSLCSFAGNSIHHDWGVCLPERRASLSLQCLQKAQLMADDGGLFHVPALVANGAPSILVEDFNPTAQSTIAVHQSDHAV